MLKVKYKSTPSGFYISAGCLPVDIDNFDNWISSVLLRTQNDRAGGPMGFDLCSWNDVTCTYDTTNGKCTTVLWAVLPLRSYLKHCRTYFLTDHNALKSIPSLIKIRRKLGLSNYNYQSWNLMSFTVVLWTIKELTFYCNWGRLEQIIRCFRKRYWHTAPPPSFNQIENLRANNMPD